jgi:predicted regulator of Ras-like GTPase activity (Roadblock/LC7/MglB family)
MPFNYLLTNLLVDVPEAVGAIFLDDEGEAVEWVTRHNDPFDLKVEGAYHSIFVRRLAIITSTGNHGKLKYFVIKGDALTALTHTLPDGYYLVLILDRPGFLGKAVFHLEHAAAVLGRELS